MPFKDPEKKKEWMRNYQRVRRAGQLVTGRRYKVLLTCDTPEERETARGLLRILGNLIGDVLTTKEGDVFMRSRTSGYLISIGLKAVEVAGLEARVSNLEARIGGQK